MRNRVVICEASEMIAIGLAEIIDSMAQFDVVARLDSPEHLSEKITASDANLLIVDPMLLGFHNKDFLSQLGKEHPQVIMIALVTSYLDHSLLMNKEIADQMNISIHTVISHRKNITRKTGIKSVSGLTVYALLNNLIDEKDLI